MVRNQAKKAQGPSASISLSWKRAIKKNTRRKSRQMGKQYLNNLL